MKKLKTEDKAGGGKSSSHKAPWLLENETTMTKARGTTEDNLDLTSNATKGRPSFRK